MRRPLKSLPNNESGNNIVTKKNINKRSTMTSSQVYQIEPKHNLTRTHKATRQHKRSQENANQQKWWRMKFNQQQCAAFSDLAYSLLDKQLSVQHKLRSCACVCVRHSVVAISTWADIIASVLRSRVRLNWNVLVFMSVPECGSRRCQLSQLCHSLRERCAIVDGASTCRPVYCVMRFCGFWSSPRFSAFCLNSSPGDDRCFRYKATNLASTCALDFYQVIEWIRTIQRCVSPQCKTDGWLNKNPLIRDSTLLRCEDGAFARVAQIVHS